MATPFEELEYLTENLPEEGESIVVSRMYGDLVCSPYQPEIKAVGMPRNQVSAPQIAAAQIYSTHNMQAPQQHVFNSYIPDERTYGQLIQLKLTMQQTFWLNLFPWAIGIYWMCVLSHLLTGNGWEGFYLDGGIILVGIFAAFSFARYRVWRCFQKAVFPVLRDIVVETKRDKFELVAGLRHFPELEPVTKALCRWTV
jgi:hypothetical protein